MLRGGFLSRRTKEAPIPRTLSPEHKAKLAAGRAKSAAAKKAARSAGAKDRVEAYTAWCRASRDYYAQPREDRVGPAPIMPELPSDQDYRDVGRLPTYDQDAS